MFRFLDNCRVKEHLDLPPFLTPSEIRKAELYWISLAQNELFAKKLESLKEGQDMLKTSSLLTSHPFMDSLSLLCVGGHKQKSNRSYSSQYPILLSGKHPLTNFIVASEYLPLLHAGAMLLKRTLLFPLPSIPFVRLQNGAGTDCKHKLGPCIHSSVPFISCSCVLGLGSKL